MDSANPPYGLNKLAIIEPTIDSSVCDSATEVINRLVSLSKKSAIWSCEGNECNFA